jgi:hypothetical protein
MNSLVSVESQSGAMPMEVKKRGSLPKSSVAGVAEPGRGAECLAESFLSAGADTSQQFYHHCLEGCDWMAHQVFPF